MACTRHGSRAAGWRNDDGELRPHKGPVPENPDLLNLASAVELRSPLPD